MDAPKIVVLAGPNAAGKSTVAPRLLRDVLAVPTFVNADQIAKGLSGFNPAESALAAGRVMLGRLRELADAGASFAFETTLASRSFGPWLTRVARSGYRVHIVFLWIRTPEIAIARVRSRVRAGGHDVPVETVRRRYRRGLRNFRRIYAPLATSWRVYDNSCAHDPVLVATGGRGLVESVHVPETWQSMRDHD